MTDLLLNACDVASHPFCCFVKSLLGSHHLLASRWPHVRASGSPLQRLAMAGLAN